jgi:hypothetical protein
VAKDLFLCYYLFQKKVKDGVEKAEQCIKMVNDLNLFSTNEEMEEVASNELRWVF